MELDELLDLEAHDVDEAELVDWALNRADALLDDARHDPELGPLLSPGGAAGEAPNPEPSPVYDGEPGPATPTPMPSLDTSSVDLAAELADEFDPATAEADARAAAQPLTDPAPGLPPTPAQARLEVMSVEEASEEIRVDDIELLDDDDLELVEEEPVDPTEPQEPVTPADPPGSVTPEWQAALVSAQHGDGMVEGLGRPEPQPADQATPPTSRLVPEEDEISVAHDLDLSDLDDLGGDSDEDSDDDSDDGEPEPNGEPEPGAPQPAEDEADNASPPPDQPEHEAGDEEDFDVDLDDDDDDG